MQGYDWDGIEQGFICWVVIVVFVAGSAGVLIGWLL